MSMYFLMWAIPFFAVSAFHLYACATEKDRRADVSKKLLMPLLIVAVLGFRLFASTGFSFNISEATAITIIGGADGPTSIYLASTLLPHIITILLCLALFCGTLGDIFLLGKLKKNNLLKGLGSFLLGHIFYIVILTLAFPFLPIPVWFTIVAVTLYTVGALGTWFTNKKPRGAIGGAVVVYALFLASVNCITLLLCAGIAFSVPSGQSILGAIPPSLILIFCGSALFLVSDIILSHTIFIGDFRLHRFFVMLSYIAAQFFIAWGICTI